MDELDQSLLLGILEGPHQLGIRPVKYRLEHGRELILGHLQFMKTYASMFSFDLIRPNSVFNSQLSFILLA